MRLRLSFRFHYNQLQHKPASLAILMTVQLNNQILLGLVDLSLALIMLGKIVSTFIAVYG